jgi:hypothetical protein
VEIQETAEGYDMDQNHSSSTLLQLLARLQEVLKQEKLGSKWIVFHDSIQIRDSLKCTNKIHI